MEKNLAAADEFTRPFQEPMTAWCWGFGWDDEVIDAKTRSMMNLAMIGALGKMHEWEVHCRGARRRRGPGGPVVVSPVNTNRLKLLNVRAGR